MFLGKFLIVGATAVVCYVLVTRWDKPAAELSSPYFPCIVAGILGYVIGAVFMSIFSFASDTILQCFLLDEELSNQGKNRPASNRPPLMNDFITNSENKGCCC